MLSIRFANINTWINAINQHASDSVNKVLLGNKADSSGPMVQKKVISTTRGQATIRLEYS